MNENTAVTRQFTDSIKPWSSSETPIYAFLTNNVDRLNCLPLPDEKLRNAVNRAFLRHNDVTDYESKAYKRDHSENIINLLKQIIHNPQRDTVKGFCHLYMCDIHLEYIDDVVKLCADYKTFNYQELERFCIWILLNCPYSNPINAAISLLKLGKRNMHVELLQIFAQYPYFTYFSAQTILETSDFYESELSRIQSYGRLQQEIINSKILK